MVIEKVVKTLKDKQYKLCVFATSSIEGKPEAAVVGYAVYDDLSIILSTANDTRKITNLSQNNKASFVCGWSFSEPNIQLDGIATLVSEGNEYQELEEFFFSQNPDAKKFKSPKTVFIKFNPTWIRFLDPTSSPPIKEETELS